MSDHKDAVLLYQTYMSRFKGLPCNSIMIIIEDLIKITVEGSTPPLHVEELGPAKTQAIKTTALRIWARPLDVDSMMDSAVRYIHSETMTSMI